MSRLSGVESDTSQLAAFVNGLPHLPPLPVALDMADINKALTDAQNLRSLLAGLPKLPPPAWPPFLPFPSGLLELDRKRQTIIDMTKWMDNLQDLPAFLQSARDLEELRSS